MAALPDGFAELKQRLRASWMAGDFGQIARLNAATAEDFVNRIHLNPGMKVLDVGCGTAWLAGTSAWFPGAGATSPPAAPIC